MAVDQPPDAAADLIGFGNEASAVSNSQTDGSTEFWRNIWPWDDLNAKSPPARWLEFQRDILPALAALVAQGPDRPRLLTTDTVGRLQVASGMNAIQALRAAVAEGDNTLLVDSVLPFNIGGYVMLVGSPGNGTAPSGPYRVLNVVANGALTIVGTASIPYKLGDYVVALPTFTALGDGFKDRPVDQPLFTAGSIGVAATLTFPGIPDMIWQLAYIDGSMRQTGATAGATTVRVFDGSAATGTQLWQSQMAVPATVGASDHLPNSKRPLKSSRGNSLTVDHTGPGATAAVMLAAGAWQSSDRGVSE